MLYFKQFKMAALNLQYLLFLRRRLIIYYLFQRRKKNRQAKFAKRRLWVRRLYEERSFKGEYELLVRDLKLYDHEVFFKYFRMTPKTFEKILNFIALFITKKTTVMRAPICAEERLAITLRYLATGDAHTTIGASYRVSPTTVGRIIHETCKVIWIELNKNGFLKVPTTTHEWRQIANDFEKRWNFPNCSRCDRWKACGHVCTSW